MLSRYKQTSGFTLVELMAVVTVLMVLVSIALPRYRLFVASSRQAEAQANLGIIASLQQSYQLKYDGNYYAGFNMGRGASGDCTDATQKNLLGFRVIDCTKLRYSYAPNSSDGGGAAINDGSKPHLLIYPKCTGSTDDWAIDDKRTLYHNNNIIEGCHN